MKTKGFLMLTVCAVLLSARWAAADWTGVMNNGMPIDEPLEAQMLDIGFDHNNHAICIVTQKTLPSNNYRLLVTRQTYGGTTWFSDGVIPIDNRNLTFNPTVQDPTLSILPSGKGMCAYAQWTGDRYRIFADWFDTNFSIVNNSNPMDTPLGANAVQPSVAQMNDTTAIIVFVQVNTNNHIFARKWEQGAGSFWSSTGWATSGMGMLQIDGTGSSPASKPHLAKSTTNELFCVFTKEITKKRIYAARYAQDQWYVWATGGWIALNLSTNLSAISRDTTNVVADNARLAALPNGQMLCVYEWINEATGNTRVHYAVYDGQQWNAAGDDYVDAAGVPGLSTNPDVAASPLGKVIAVYAQGNTENAAQHVYAAEWNPTGWQAMNNHQPIDQTGNSVTALTPKIAFDSLGNAICVFQHWSADKTRTLANYFQGPPFVESITPDSGKNNASVSLRVRGNNFAGAVSARLSKAGEPDIIGQNIVVSNPNWNFFTAREFTGEFNLDRVMVGNWDLIVENPDGQRFTAPDIFGVIWPDLKEAYVYPNPIRPGSGGNQDAQVLRFYNLTRAVTVRIYNLKGEFVRSLTKDDRQLYVDWDLKNKNGRMVAPGVYLYRLETEEGSITKGKFMVIR